MTGQVNNRNSLDTLYMVFLVGGALYNWATMGSAKDKEIHELATPTIEQNGALVPAASLVEPVAEQELSSAPASAFADSTVKSAALGAGGLSGVYASAHKLAEGAFGHFFGNWSWAAKLGVGVAGGLTAVYVAYKIYQYWNRSPVSISNTNNNTNAVTLNFEAKDGLQVEQKKLENGDVIYTFKGQNGLLLELLKEIRALRMAVTSA